MSTIVARLRSDVRLRLFLAIVVLPLDRRPVRRCGDPQNRQAAFQARPSANVANFRKQRRPEITATIPDPACGSTFGPKRK
jgi:hypothetical protein